MSIKVHSAYTLDNFRVSVMHYGNEACFCLLEKQMEDEFLGYEELGITSIKRVEELGYGHIYRSRYCRKGSGDHTVTLGSGHPWFSMYEDQIYGSDSDGPIIGITLKELKTYCEKINRIEDPHDNEALNHMQALFSSVLK